MSQLFKNQPNYYWTAPLKYCINTWMSFTSFKYWLLVKITSFYSLFPDAYSQTIKLIVGNCPQLSQTHSPISSYFIFKPVLQKSLLSSLSLMA